MVLTPGPRGLVGAGTGSTAGAAPARRDDLHEQHPARFQPVTHSGAFRAVGGGPLCAALDALLGAGQWTRPRWWGRPLVTFPRDGRWELPARAWHFDCMPVSAGRRPVQFFAFLSQVRSRPADKAGPR